MPPLCPILHLTTISRPLASRSATRPISKNKTKEHFFPTASTVCYQLCAPRRVQSAEITSRVAQYESMIIHRCIIVNIKQ